MLFTEELFYEHSILVKWFPAYEKWRHYASTSLHRRERVMTSLLRTNGVVVEKIPNSWYRPHTIKMSSCVIGDKKIQYIARAHDRRNYHNIWLERMFKKISI